MVRRANADLERRVQERTAQLRSLASELILAEQRERRRIAEYLHDNLQQLLVSSKLSVGMLQMGLKNKQLAASLEAIEKQLGTAIETSRSLTAELSPPVLYRAGLAAALTWLGKRVEEQHGLKVLVQAEAEADIGEESVRVLLFQSVRELLFNVIKHAGVDQARIRLTRREGDRVRIEVRDEGRGFDRGRVQAEGPSESFGLFSVRERIGQMGGRMEIRSAPGKGTLVTLIVPAVAPAAEASELPTTPSPSSRRKPSAPRRSGGRASS
jgi:signal transduction histidine kinase